MLFWHLGVTTLAILISLGRRRIDFRVVLFGAILPDLIDKPIGRIFFEETFQTSRIFGHTILFATALLVVVTVLRGDLKRSWFVLPMVVVIHFGLDAMWRDPVTLFWPFFGTEFPPVPVDNYWFEVLLRPLRHPAEAVKELVGLLVLIYVGVAYRLNRRGPRKEFLRTGALQADRQLEQASN